MALLTEKENKAKASRLRKDLKSLFLRYFLCVCLRAHSVDGKVEGYVGWECNCAYIIMSLHKLATIKNKKYKDDISVTSVRFSLAQCLRI